MRHFNDADYRIMTDAVISAGDDCRYDRGEFELISVEVKALDVALTVKHYEDGRWLQGGDEGEFLWEATNHHYVVSCFECFDNDGNDMPNDFISRQLGTMLNAIK